VSDQVSHPYKTKGKIIVLYVIIYKFLNSKLEDKRFCTEWQQALLEYNFVLLKFIPKYLILPHFQRSYYQSLYCDILLNCQINCMDNFCIFNLHILIIKFVWLNVNLHIPKAFTAICIYAY
jgi:hypothetical protein